MQVALDVINRRLHILFYDERIVRCEFNSSYIKGFMDLLNCVFSFQGKFYRQLQGAVMYPTFSLIVANIYMEHFKEGAVTP